LTLGIGAHQVLISQDEMSQVFDYDPLFEEIDRLAAIIYHDTEERPIERIAQACAT
jgi:hypothetical protein